MMYLFLLVGNPIYCRLYCQRVMHPHPWLSADKRSEDFWQAVYLILGLHLNICAQPNLNHNYVFIFLIAFRKVELGELNALLFSLLKARMCVRPGYWIAPVGPEWIGTFILGVHMHFLFIVPHVARFLPKTCVCWLVVLKLFRTFASAGGSLNVSFPLNLKDLFKFHICRVVRQTLFFCSRCYWDVFVRESKREDFKIFELQSYQVKLWVGNMDEFTRLYMGFYIA